MAVLWVHHGLAPCDTLSAPPEVLAAALRLLEAKQAAVSTVVADADEQRVRAELRGML